MLAKPHAEFMELEALEISSLRKRSGLFLVSAMEVYMHEVVVNATLLEESTLTLGYYHWQDQGQSIGQKLEEGLEDAINEAY